MFCNLYSAWRRCIICIELGSSAFSNFYSAWQLCILCIDIYGTAFDSLESSINARYMQCCYCMSGIIFSCNTARLPIWCPLHVGSIIATFVGFVISVIYVLLSISNVLVHTCYPASIQTYCAQREFCCRSWIIATTLILPPLMNLYSAWRHCGNMPTKFL